VKTILLHNISIIIIIIENDPSSNDFAASLTPFPYTVGVLLRPYHCTTSVLHHNISITSIIFEN